MNNREQQNTLQLALKKLECIKNLYIKRGQTPPDYLDDPYYLEQLKEEQTFENNAKNFLNGVCELMFTDRKNTLLPEFRGHYNV